MKTLILVVAMFVVGCVALVWAQPQGTLKPSAKPEQPTKIASVEKVKAIGGEVVSVDTTAKTITVKYKSGKTEAFQVDPKVIVKKAGKTITLTSLSAGEKVTLSFETAGGKKVATQITVKTPPVKKEPTAKKETAPAPK